MTTSKDRQRVEAFRAWMGLLGGLDAVAAHTGIALRSLERMRAGKQPPPVRLLDRAAEEVERADWQDRAALANAIARDLRAAASMEAHDA